VRDRHDADRLAVLEAISLGLDDPHRLVDVVATAEGDPVRAVMAAYGVPEHGAVAMLDIQFRRLAPRDRRRIAEEIASIRERLPE